ncbi:MAG TPA: UDP-glucose 4-epimerase GalE [Candidatus Cryosericum sp.]|nr:UDP-glucose 4-epimerase GalE [Candidatus Cryosericum sp.]
MDGSVLVTGGAGYIGSHTVRRLLQNSYKVVVLDNLSKGHTWAVPPEVPLVIGDIADVGLVAQTIRQFGVTSVIHFAAFSLVGESMSDPRAYYSNNVAGTLRLLDAMRVTGTSRIVFSSTAAVYGEPARVPIDEDSALHPTSVYGRTKLAIEGMLEDYAAAYGLRYISLRYFNAAGADPGGGIGEVHNPETHLIPLVLQAASGRRPFVEVFGTDYATADGTCIRDYIHVTDLADAHILALQSLDKQNKGVYNLGSSQGFSVRQIISTAEGVVGHPIPVVESRRRSGDPAVLVASNVRARAELGWNPSMTDLELIVRTAWEWEQNRLHV